MPPSSRHPPPSHMMPATITDSSQPMGGIPNLMNVQPLQGMPAPDPPAGNNPSASALFNLNLMAPGSSNFGMMPPPPPPPNPPQNSSNLNNPTAALDAMLRPGLAPTKKDQAALSKFAATIGMIPPPGSSGTGSPHGASEKANKRPDNSIFGTDFSFMDGMPRNEDSSRMWSHKSGDGFGSKTPNFSDPSGPPLGSIGSHAPSANEAKLDNAFSSQMNFGPTGFFGNSNSNNAPPSSNFGSGLSVPFGNLGGMGGGNGNGSGDAPTPLPPFPLLWGNSGLGLKNMGSAPSLGGFQANSETIQSSAGDIPDSNASNWNGNAPRS